MTDQPAPAGCDCVPKIRETQAWITRMCNEFQGELSPAATIGRLEGIAAACRCAEPVADGPIVAALREWLTETLADDAWAKAPADQLELSVMFMACVRDLRTKLDALVAENAAVSRDEGTVVAAPFSEINALEDMGIRREVWRQEVARQGSRAARVAEARRLIHWEAMFSMEPGELGADYEQRAAEAYVRSQEPAPGTP